MNLLETLERISAASTKEEAKQLSREYVCQLTEPQLKAIVFAKDWKAFPPGLLASAERAWQYRKAQRMTIRQFMGLDNPKGAK
jgi:hypothetical protein